MDIGTAKNYQYINEINTTPNGDAATWEWFGPGIKNITSETNETASEDYFFDGGGDAETSVDGKSRSYTVTGVRRIGDPAQDYVASLDDETGDALMTQYRVTDPTGKVIERDVTVHEIKANDATGDANSRTDFSCKLSCAGKPRIVRESDGRALPDKITAEAVSVEVGATGKVSASVDPPDASQRVLCAVENPKVAEVTPDGTVTGLAAGETTVTVRAASKPSVMKQVKLTVTEAAAKSAKPPAGA